LLGKCQADLYARDGDETLSRAITRSVDVNRLIPAVLHEWREPRHREFQERDVWSLFNSFTEALKDGNLAELPKRTEALHGLLDVAVGLNCKRSRRSASIDPWDSSGHFV
jgi:hypothetical protein